MNRIQLRFGQAVGLKELVATLVVSGVLLIVGTVVFAKVKTSMGNDLTGDANTTVTNVETTTYDAFELATVALIVNCSTVKIGVQSIASCCGYHRYFNQSIRCLRLGMYLTFGFCLWVDPGGGMVGNDHPHFFLLLKKGEIFI